MALFISLYVFEEDILFSKQNDNRYLVARIDNPILECSIRFAFELGILQYL